MKVSNIQIMNSVSALQEVFALKLPPKVAFSVAKNIGAVQDATVAFEKARLKLVEEHAQKDDDGKTVQDGQNVKLADPVGFAKVIEELAMIEQELDIIPVSVDSLGDAPISVGALTSLRWMLVE